MLTSKRTIILYVTLITVGVLTATLYTLSVGGDGPPDKTWEVIQQRDRIIVAVDPSYPPFATYGEPLPSGLDVDIALAIADEMGVEVQFSGQSFDALYDTLTLKTTDIVISAIRYDPLRRDTIYYSQPYVDVGQVFVVRGESNLVVEDFADLASTQYLAVEFASQGDLVARQYLEEHPESFLLERPLSAEETLDLLINGEVDVALVDRVTVGDYVLNRDATVKISSPVVSDQFVIAMRIKDWRLAFEIEQALDNIKANGTLDEIHRRWLGDLPEMVSN